MGQKCIDPLWWINWLISQVYWLIKLAYNMRGSTNKSPIKLSMQQKINWHDDLFTNGKNLYCKTPPSILTSPLSRIYYYQNKWLQVKESQYLLPTYNWTLTPIPNWTCSVVTISHFQYTAPSMWLTNCANLNTWLDHQLKKDVVCKILQFITQWRSWSCLVTKPYGVQNTAASSRERRTKAN